MGSGLTQNQKKMVKELYEIHSLTNMDFWNIEEYPKEQRTNLLEIQKRQAITGAIVMQYTLIDEALNCEICTYFFGSSKSFKHLWRTKKFQSFNYYISESLYLLEKLRLVRTFCEIPKNIVEEIERLDALRNALAHAFFPENLRRYKKWHKTVYKGKDIFTLEGITLFLEDMERVNEFFSSRTKRYL